MMDAQLELKLIECLDLLEAGQPIERILAQFPDDAASLRPLLETAELLPSLGAEPTPAAQQASRRSFLNQAHALREQPARRWFWLQPRLATTLAAVVIVLLSFSSVVAASSNALPDQALYPVKRTVEDARLMLAGPAGQAALSDEFMQRRRSEVAALLASERAAEVTLEGIVEAIAPDRWRIAGFSALLTPATSIQGQPAVGARAQLRGHTAGGALFADTITIVPGSAPVPTSTPTATATATATATSTPTATATATATSTPAPTATPTARPTAAPTRAPTRAPQPPTQPPPPPPTLDDNGNDNANSNDDNDGSGGGNDNTNDNANSNDDNGGSGGGNDNTNDNANSNDDSGGGNDNANSNDDSGSGGGNDNKNDNKNSNDDNSGSGGGNDNKNDNKNSNDSGGDDKSGD